ncbi:MAG: aminopeptidase P family N-terminal domain-containing protein, partial [Solirubrobacteraceae bacterium]
MSRERLDRLHELLAGEELDALIVEGAANLRYLTGYTGSNGLALVLAAGGDRFFTDFRYASQIAEELEPSFTAEIISGELLDAISGGLPGGRVGFDDGQLSVRRHARLRELVDDGVELVGASGLVERLRAVKD